MRLFPNLLLFVLGGSPLSSALAASCEPGEIAHLVDEMNGLAGRQAWKGVEQRFSQIEGCGVSPDTLRLAAEAARVRGDVTRRVRRLRAAQDLEAREDVAAEIAVVSQTFGRIVIEGRERRPPALAPERWPFAPDQRNAILFADETLRQTGRFDGLLPVGSYELSDGSRFTVEPGPALQSVSAGAAPGPAPLLAWHGLVVEAGPSFLSSPQPSRPTTWVDGSVQFEPETVGLASGAALSVGYELGLSRALGVTPSISASTVLGKHHLDTVRGSLLFTARDRGLRFAIGPTWGVVSGSGTGVASWYGGVDGPEVEVQWVGYRGLSWGPGLEASVGKEAWTLPRGVALVDVHGAIQNDGSRPYASFGARIGWAPKTKRPSAISTG